MIKKILLGISFHAGAGYFVFLINTDHVATVFPDNIKDKTYKDIELVQAGRYTGIKKLTNIFNVNDPDKPIKHFLYLGFLKN